MFSLLFMTSFRAELEHNSVAVLPTFRTKKACSSDPGGLNIKIQMSTNDDRVACSGAYTPGAATVAGNWATLPLVFGIMAFVYSGHGVFPSVRASMKRPEQFPKVGLLHLEALDLTNSGIIEQIKVIILEWLSVANISTVCRSVCQQISLAKLGNATLMHAPVVDIGIFPSFLHEPSSRTASRRV